jgi:hypothetical protein
VVTTRHEGDEVALLLERERNVRRPPHGSTARRQGLANRISGGVGLVKRKVMVRNQFDQAAVR